jgi:UDP-N-acetylglucosamine acyltransferase
MVRSSTITQNTDNILALNPSIHPTAIISSKAQIAANVTIGPYAIIGENVTIDEGTSIGPHAIIEGWTTIGKRNQIAAGAVIGNYPQDLKFDGEQSFVEIGDDNIIREYATINRGTKGGGLYTRIGNHNLLMTSSHIAHDAQVGNHNVIGHSTLIGGHAIIESYTTIGVMVGIHQFVKVGNVAMIGSHSRIIKDIAPYALVQGTPVKLYGLNLEKLKRLNYTFEQKKVLKKAYQIIFKSALTIKQAVEKIEESLPPTKEIQNLLQFIQNSSRGLYR